MSTIPEPNLKLINETGQSMVELLRDLKSGKIDHKTASAASRIASKGILALGKIYIDQAKTGISAENAKSYRKISEAALINATVRQEQHEAKKAKK